MRFVILLCFPLLSLASAPAFPADWAPCGGQLDKLWSWIWAGENGEFATLKQASGGARITDLLDLSGNGHHYFNHSGEREPAYQVGLNKDGYSTLLPVIALDRYSSGTQVYLQWMEQNTTMIADQFYLAFAGMNTRSAGNRDLWGTSESNLVWIDQAENRAYIVIDGSTHKIADKGSVEKGAIVLEIWRDSYNKIHTWVNGFDVSMADASSNKVFSMSGIGWDQGGTSGWDDYAFEYIACNGEPTPEQRISIREYLRSKWNIYGETEPAVKPEAPTDLRAE